MTHRAVGLVTQLQDAPSQKAHAPFSQHPLTTPLRPHLPPLTPREGLPTSCLAELEHLSTPGQELVSLSVHLRDCIAALGLTECYLKEGPWLVHCLVHHRRGDLLQAPKGGAQGE